MIVTPLKLPGAFVVDLEKREDGRGFFARTFCARELQAAGLDSRVAQMNISLSREPGTVRGFHFQRPPLAETKIVRCVRGAVWDVVIDLRRGSPTFGQWTAETLTGESGRMMYVPKGFGHAFQTLEPDTEIIYVHSEFYSPEHEGGLYYADPALGIPWPKPVTVLSERDQRHPRLAQLDPIIP